MIGIIADSQDEMDALNRAVELLNDKKTGLVIHAGDLVALFTLRAFKRLDCPVKAVIGNNDGGREGPGRGEISVPPLVFNYRGKRISRVHDIAGYKGVVDTDIAVYGHSHEAARNFS